MLGRRSAALTPVLTRLASPLDRPKGDSASYVNRGETNELLAIPVDCADVGSAAGLLALRPFRPNSRSNESSVRPTISRETRRTFDHSPLLRLWLPLNLC